METSKEHRRECREQNHKVFRTVAKLFAWAIVLFVVAMVLPRLLGCSSDDCAICPNEEADRFVCGESEIWTERIESNNNGTSHIYAVTWRCRPIEGLRFSEGYITVSVGCVQELYSYDAALVEKDENWYVLKVSGLRNDTSYQTVTVQGHTVFTKGDSLDRTDLVCRTPCKLLM